MVYHYHVWHCDLTRGGRWSCRCLERTRRFSDPLEVVDTELKLTQASRLWIEGTLTQRYPGAHVKARYPERLHWSFYSGGPGRSWAYGLIRRYPLEDPGRYLLTLFLRTAGTPVSAPQSRTMRFIVPANLLEDAQSTR